MHNNYQVKASDGLCEDDDTDMSIRTIKQLILKIHSLFLPEVALLSSCAQMNILSIQWKWSIGSTIESHQVTTNSMFPADGCATSSHVFID